MVIPLIAWRYLSRRRAVFAYLVSLFLILIVLFALRSRAGMAISLGLALFCFLWFLAKDNDRLVQGVLTGLGAVVLLAAGFLFATSGGGDESELRFTIYANVLPAIKDHWLTGAGLGSFAQVYPFYEPREDIISEFAYHVHNDFLELFLEGGLIAVFLVVVFAAMVTRDMFVNHLTQAAGLAIASIMIHSLVDYPLRTYAIAVPFAVLCAIVFSNRFANHSLQHEKSATYAGFGFIQVRQRGS